MTNWKERLDHLTPERRALMEVFLRNPRQKVRLPANDPPVGEMETALAGIWSRTLRVAEIGRNENYFDLGGDSLQAIQIVARARKLGIPVDVSLLFGNPTIAGLAGAVSQAEHTFAWDVDPGPVPLSPIQKWFFDLKHGNVSHWNQAVLLKVRAFRQPGLIRTSLEAVISSYDALRLRFSKSDGGWSQRLDEGAPSLWRFSQESVDTESPKEIGRKLDEIALQAQSSINIEHGPLLHAVYIHARQSDHDWLLLVCHHLVSDAMSFRFLIGDMESALRDVASGGPVRPAPAAPSFSQWARAMAAHSGNGGFQSEHSYWLQHTAGTLTTLPVDFPAGSNREGEATRLEHWLNEEDSRRLHEQARGGDGHAAAEAILLTAFEAALFRWTGSGQLLVDIEWHGRPPGPGGLDVSQTFGWFTSRFPVRLDRHETDLVDRLVRIKHLLRSVPNGGHGYGFLRYSGEDELATHEPAQILFNYLGKFDNVLAGNDVFEPGPEHYGPLYCAKSERPYLLQFTAMEINRRLQLNWYYSPALHKRETIEFLRDSMIAVIQQLTCSQRRVLTADFPDSDLSQEELDRLFQ